MKNLRTAVSAILISICTISFLIHLAAGETAVQIDYPTRTIRLLVGFGPGTSPDIAARVLGDKLSQAWGKPVVIENAVGASGNIAGERAARAEPDGHTLLLAANSGSS